MEDNVKICQSCGMPISEDKQRGTNEDGSLSDDYCSYCFKKGKFTQNVSLDEQVEIGLSYYPAVQESKNTGRKRFAETTIKRVFIKSKKVEILNQLSSRKGDKTEIANEHMNFTDKD